MRQTVFFKDKCAIQFFSLFFLLSFQVSSSFCQVPESYNKISAFTDCSISNESTAIILDEVRKKNPNAISSLIDCLKMNRKLIFQASIIDASQFQYAADILKNDINFVNRILAVNSEILKYLPNELKTDKNFIKNATYLNREALQYADSKLLNDKIFMKEMIVLDSKNYIFASNQIKEIAEYAEIAFSDNGSLLQFATDKIKNNKKLVTIAVKSNSEALQYASQKLQKDKNLQKLAAHKTTIKSTVNLEEFLRQNYLDDSQKKNVGVILANRAKFSKKSKIIDRNYIVKWQKFIDYDENNNLVEQTKLISDSLSNYPNSWQEDFKKYPELVKKIEKFFSTRQVDQNTIDELTTTYLWKVKQNPLTLVFNLYLMRETKDFDLGAKFANVTSLTAIAQKIGKNWKLSVIEVIFDEEVKVDVAFEEGHKKYYFWDLYKIDKKDKSPKIIFRTEEKFADFFEIFEEQNNGKYKMIHRFNPFIQDEENNN